MTSKNCNRITRLERQLGLDEAAMLQRGIHERDCELARLTDKELWRIILGDDPEKYTEAEKTIAFQKTVGEALCPGDLD